MKKLTLSPTDRPHEVFSATTLPIDKIKQLAVFEAEYKKIKESRDRLREELLQLTQELDVYTLKTGDYTITRGKRVTPQVTNYKLLRRSLDEAKIPYEVHETFTPQMTAVFREVVRMGKELDGLEATETEYVSIRVKNGQK